MPIGDNSEGGGKPSLNHIVLDNYLPISSIPFWGKIMERVVVSQPQRFLDEANYLDPFQPGFRPGIGPVRGTGRRKAIHACNT